jgi:DNA invertase Pin-like site-specific DNA recombinase
MPKVAGNKHLAKTRRKAVGGHKAKPAASQPAQAMGLSRAPVARYVAYFRVSTAKQGLTGLGMDAQRTAVAEYLRTKGTSAALLAEYVEVESGRNADRPELTKAMDHAKGARATLLIAKLDRLSRDVHFLTGLERGGVEFVACDMPDANRLTITILAAVAEHERKLISERTKAALAEARKRIATTGQRKHRQVKRLGNPNGAAAMMGLGNAAAVSAIKAGADAKALDVRRAVSTLMAGGVASARGIARKLNEQGYRTPRAAQWDAKAVTRLTARLDALSAGEEGGRP